MLASAKQVSDIHALSVHPTCTWFACVPACVPKVLGSCCPIALMAFSPLPSSFPGGCQMHMLCPVHALLIYMDRTGHSRALALDCHKNLSSLHKPEAEGTNGLAGLFHFWPGYILGRV